MFIKQSIANINCEIEVDSIRLLKGSFTIKIIVKAACVRCVRMMMMMIKVMGWVCVCVCVCLTVWRRENKERIWRLEIEWRIVSNHNLCVKFQEQLYKSLSESVSLS